MSIIEKDHNVRKRSVEIDAFFSYHRSSLGGKYGLSIDCWFTCRQWCCRIAQQLIENNLVKALNLSLLRQCRRVFSLYSIQIQRFLRIESREISKQDQWYHSSSMDSPLQSRSF